MARLSVNVNKIATLRNTRANGIPDLVRLCADALDAGADGITVHPRPDQRHIRPADVDAIASLLDDYPRAEYNIEGNPFLGLVEHCERVQPDQATLVPDAPDAQTSNLGWDLARLTGEERGKLTRAIQRLRDCGCRVSLFVDPSPLVPKLAQELGADRVELYTEPYAIAYEQGKGEAAVASFAAAASAAHTIGLGVNAGHDLSLVNLRLFLTRVWPVDEVSIGHALIADAIALGLAETIRRYHILCACGH
ncbi:MAG: pyridoxine 5'-phosphate synthase [Polyangia bacterium]|jgi:pyridoxine 5-phosphate synthase